MTPLLGEESLDEPAPLGPTFRTAAAEVSSKIVSTIQAAWPALFGIGRAVVLLGWHKVVDDCINYLVEHVGNRPQAEKDQPRPHAVSQARNEPERKHEA